MYIGVGPEEGNRIPEREAFGYACNRCLFGDSEEERVFLELLDDSEDLEEFSKKLVEWFFSGNWFYDDHDAGKQAWIIRYSDKSLQSHYDTYVATVIFAREIAKKKGLGFVVN